MEIFPAIRTGWKERTIAIETHFSTAFRAFQFCHSSFSVLRKFLFLQSVEIELSILEINNHDVEFFFLKRKLYAARIDFNCFTVF